MPHKSSQAVIRGGQTFLYNFRMYVQVLGRISLWSAVLAALGGIIVMWLLIPLEEWQASYYYFLAKFFV